MKKKKSYQKCLHPNAYGETLQANNQQYFKKIPPALNQYCFCFSGNTMQQPNAFWNPSIDISLSEKIDFNNVRL